MNAERIEGWERRLAAVIARGRQTPYQLGTHDCFRVACMAIEAVTGVDRWPEFAGRYSDKTSALRLIASYGDSFTTAFNVFFGAEPVNTKLTRRGDIAEFHTDEPHLGVCVGADVAVTGQNGLSFVRLDRCVHAWRIG